MPWADVLTDDAELALHNREQEALDAGLQVEEAIVFAHSTVDVGLLRKLVAADCPVRLLAEILL